MDSKVSFSPFTLSAAHFSLTVLDLQRFSFGSLHGMNTLNLLFPPSFPASVSRRDPFPASAVSEICSKTL